MASGYSEGTTVAWDWGSGTASGRIVTTYTEKQTLTLKVTEVTRDASGDCPAYEIEQSDGDMVLKSHSEVRKA